MHALVSTIEKNDTTHFMSTTHGFFSLGGFIGASIGSVLLKVVASPNWHMFMVSVFILLSDFYLSKFYVEIEETKASSFEKHSIIKNIRPLLGLAIVALIIMFNEGAVEHRSNLFLFSVVQLKENLAGLGFIAFSLCMTLGRFLGGGISKNLAQ